jgi:hypothetical protein
MKYDRKWPSLLRLRGQRCMIRGHSESSTLPSLMRCRQPILAPERATHAPLVVAGSCNRALEAGTGRVAHEEKPVRLFKAAVTPLLPPNWGCYERGRQQRLLCVRGRERGVLLRLVTGLVTAWLPITRLRLRAGDRPLQACGTASDQFGSDPVYPGRTRPDPPPRGGGSNPT